MRHPPPALLVVLIASLIASLVRARKQIAVLPAAAGVYGRDVPPGDSADARDRHPAWSWAPEPTCAAVGHWEKCRINGDGRRGGTGGRLDADAPSEIDALWSDSAGRTDFRDYASSAGSDCAGCFAVPAARRAARIDPVVALREE
jgi:hypothetical protein